MYINLIIGLLVMYFLYLFIMEYIGYVPDHDIKYPMNYNIQNNNNNNNENYNNYDYNLESFNQENKTKEQKPLEYQSEPIFPPITYENDYKPLLNQESLYKFVPQYDYIKKILLPNKETTISQLYTLSQELSFREMDEYLSIVKNKVNLNIINKEKLLKLKKIKRSEWNQKELLSQNVFETFMLDLFKKKSDKYRNLDLYKSTIDYIVLEFVNLMNDNFIGTKFHEIYNKHQPFTPYLISNIKIMKYFEHKEDPNIMRFIVIFRLHRQYKTNDFNILLDLYIKGKNDKINLIKSTEQINSFNKDNLVFIRTSRVYGMPIAHNNKYLDYDDTNNFVVNKPLINYELKNKINKLKKEVKKIEDNKIQKYLEFIGKVELIDLNKNFNQQQLLKLIKLKNELNMIPNKLNEHKQLDKVVNSIINQGYSYISQDNLKSVEFNSEIDYDPIELENNLYFLKSSFNIEKEDIINNINNKNNKLTSSENKEEKEKVKQIEDSIYNPEYQIYLDKIQKQKEEEKLFNKYQCFHPNKEDVILERLNNKMFCESFHKKVSTGENIEILNNNGVWDRICIKNEECPYYLANKNYPNNFGKCINGKCEMPVGVQRIGKRQVSDTSEPQCHNCDDVTKTNCCYSQLDNINYESPDFMFEGDALIRNQQKSHLIEKGLKV